MKVCERGVMPDGTNIQIEDWSKDYPETFTECGTIAAYPIAKCSSHRYFGPRYKETFRLTMNFDSKEESNKVFNELKQGTPLLNYESYFEPLGSEADDPKQYL